MDPPNPGSAQISENSSTLGLDYEVKKNCRIFLLDTIQEPLPHSFRNTPYFNLSDNSSTFSFCPKFRNFQNSQTLDSHPLYQNYLFDRSKGCFENLFPMALEWYQANAKILRILHSLPVL